MREVDPEIKSFKKIFFTGSVGNPVTNIIRDKNHSKPAADLYKFFLAIYLEKVASR